MKGWVYVISNKAMPGLVKVGHSTKDPEIRAEELNHTGSPHPYLVEYWMLIEDPYQIEQQIHNLLSSKREAKEWFRCTAEEAVVAIKQVAGSRAIIENYTRAERAKAEALHRQKVKEQKTRLAQEKVKKDIEERLRSEVSVIREKFQRQIKATFPPLPALFFRNYAEKKRKQSTAYLALEKKRDEELAAVYGRVMENMMKQMKPYKDLLVEGEEYNRAVFEYFLSNPIKYKWD